MSAPKKDTQQITIRLPKSVVAEALKLAASTRGSVHPWTYTDILRAAMVFGLAEVKGAIARSSVKAA